MNPLQVIPSSPSLTVAVLLHHRAFILPVSLVFWNHSWFYRLEIDELIRKFLKFWSVFSLLYKGIKIFGEFLL